MTTENCIYALRPNIIKRLEKPISKLKGDHLHLLKRISETISRKNGASAIIMRALSDALFKVCAEDLERAVQALREQGMDEHQIAVQKKMYWKQSILKHCRRGG